jgi:hypothetical protein
MANKHFDRPENAEKLDVRAQGLLLWVQDSRCMIANKPVDRKASRRSGPAGRRKRHLATL